MDSFHFLIGVPTQETVDLLTVKSGAAPIKINHSPIAYLSPPQDRSTLRLDFSTGTEFALKFVHHGFVYNPETQRTEFLCFLEVPVPTLLSDIGVDLRNFRPYLRFAVDPMRTRKIRFWCKNFGDSFIGEELMFNFALSGDGILRQEFNSSTMMDTVHSCSDGL